MHRSKHISKVPLSENKIKFSMAYHVAELSPLRSIQVFAYGNSHTSKKGFISQNRSTRIESFLIAATQSLL